MSFWIELLPGASKIQFPGRLLVFVVTIAVVCMGVSVEGALRSDVPVVRYLALVLPLFGATWQYNQTRGNQSAIWWLHVDRSVADAELAKEGDVLSHKVSMNQSWNDFLPNFHGNNSAVQPLLAASKGCKITSPSLTHGAPVDAVTTNVAGPLSFTVLGHGCTVKLDQIQSVLLQAQFSWRGSVRQTQDGLTLLDVPDDGTLVTVRARGWLDLAGKFLVEKTRRRP